MQQSKTTNRR